ncbi:MAG: hypothetical protein GXP31_17530, partial [Kiritimatiellaeota bacterium]|nr:hypothetical protein [Kiritimatiellota bacterium]
MIGVECLFLAGAVQAFQPAIISVRLDRTVVRPGGTIRATYVLTNLGTAPADRQFTFFAHPRLVDRQEGTYRMFGADFAPLVPTTRWRRLERIEETRPIRIPPDAPPGEYRLLIGMYDPASGRTALANRELATPDLRYEIARFSILPPDGPESGQKPFERTFIRVRCTLPEVAKPNRTQTLRNDEIEVAVNAA